ncbi:MAG: FHA domain-containing protein [Actinomycetota bacterium]
MAIEGDDPADDDSTETQTARNVVRTQLTVAVEPGSGRAIRTENGIAYAVAPIDGLHDLMRRECPDIIQAVAAFIIENHFDLPGLAVASFGPEPALLVFGDVAAAVGHTTRVVSGRGMRTWVEAELTDAEVRVGTIGHSPSGDDDTNLIAGCVPAAGVRWSVRSAAMTTPAPRPRPEIHTPPSPPASVKTSRPTPTEAPSAATPPVPPVSTSTRPAMTDDNRVGTTGTARGHTGPVAPVATPPAPTTAFATSSTTVTPSPGSSDGIHEFHLDDGTVIGLDGHHYVGRYPTKMALPDGVTPVTVSGEEVSRLHFEVVIDGSRATVKDLGSAAGTTVERPGRNARDVVSERIPTRLGDGSIVHFGGRWARLVVSANGDAVNVDVDAEPED